MNNIIELNANLARNTFGTMPNNIDFDVVFEPTKVSHKKYVVNGATGEYLDTVGDTFPIPKLSNIFLWSNEPANGS